MDYELLERIVAALERITAALETLAENSNAEEARAALEQSTALWIYNDKEG